MKLFYNRFFVFFFLFFSFCLNTLFSQEIKRGEVYVYARKVVDTMASASMHGRGYVLEGDKIAANYIRAEFQKFGLEKFTEDYYQTFNIPINTYPGKMSIVIDNKELTPGKDYIVNSSSVKSNFTKDIYYFKFSEYNKGKKAEKKINKKFKDKFVWNDTLASKKENRYTACINGAAGVINVEKKLTWFMSQREEKCMEILMLNDVSITNAQKIKIDIENKFFPNYQTQNIISYVKGAVYPDSFIVFTAHYDHLGHMGKDVYFPGANDNASGCAMLLNLAKYYSKPENKPKYSIAFMAFGAEEVGILGSKHYVENPLFPLKNIKFLYNMDIQGTGEEGITVVNGSVFTKEFEVLKKINQENNFLKEIKPRGKAAISDHYFFTEKGVKCFYSYTMGGIKAYHDIYDRAETLPLNEFENVFKLLTTFCDYLQK